MDFGSRLDILTNGSPALIRLSEQIRKKEDIMTHPKQLDEVGITESYLRKMAKKEGVTYKKAVQIAMEQWGEYSLKLINKIVAEDIKTR
jgi:hypothetical protein